ncbi:Ste/ste11 protein kinase, partial [Globisporangium splendens]
MRSGEQFAVKQIYIQEELEQGNDMSSLSIQRALSRQQIQRETSLLAEFAHPNIVQYIGCGRRTAQLLLKEFGPFHESTIRSYIQQTLCGVQYLHAMGIAHRDLKCANLLLADDGRIKIADFGTAKKKMETATPEDYGVAGVQQQHALETASTSMWGSVASDLPTEQEAFLFPDSSSTYLEAPIPTHTAPSARTLNGDDLGDAKAVPPQGAQEEVGVVPSNSDEAVENAAIVDSREDSPHTAQVNVSSRSERQVESAAAITEVAPQEDASDDEASSCASFSSDSGSPHSAASRNSLSSDDDNEPSTTYSSSSDDDNDGSLSATGSFSTEEKKEEEPRFQVLGTVRAIADYASADPNGLSMAEGDTLEVLEMRSSGWWRGRLRTKQHDDDTDDTAIAVGWSRAHTSSQENELSVQEGDVVHVTASEWRDGCLWAHGSIVSSDDHTRNSSSRQGKNPLRLVGTAAADSTHLWRLLAQHKTVEQSEQLVVVVVDHSSTKAVVALGAKQQARFL